jgi:hypothetical protein
LIACIYIYIHTYIHLSFSVCAYVCVCRCGDALHCYDSKLAEIKAWSSRIKVLRMQYIYGRGLKFAGR